MTVLLSVLVMTLKWCIINSTCVFDAVSKCISLCEQSIVIGNMRFCQCNNGEKGNDIELTIVSHNITEQRFEKWPCKKKDNDITWNNDRDGSSAGACKTLDRTGNHTVKFMGSCTNGQLDLVKCYVSLHLVDINLKWINGVTPLMLAARHGEKAVFDFLVSHGCDLDTKQDNGGTVLHWACSGGNLDIVRYLIEKKCFNKDIPDNHGNTPLHTAAFEGNVEVVKYLLSQGSHIHARDNQGCNVLHLACEKGHLEIVKLLVAKLGTESRNKKGETPAMSTAIGDYVAVLKYLVHKGCEIHVVDRRNNTLLHHACMFDSIKVAEYMIDDLKFGLEVQNRNDFTPFLMAAYSNSSRVFHLLADHGCNVSAIDIYNNSALHLSVKFGNMDMIKELVDKYHFDVNQRGRHHNTPLFTAALRGNLPVFKFLLKRGAEPSLKNDHNNGVLQHAVYHNDNLDLVKEIIEVNPNINDFGDWNRTAVMVAARRGSLECFKFLVKKGAILQGFDMAGNNIFHIACKGGNVEILKLLIQKGEENKRMNFFNETALDIAKEPAKSFLYKRWFQRV